MNCFDLGRQDSPFGVGVRAQLLSCQQTILVQPHVTRLDRLVLGGFGDANNIEVVSLGIIER
jgi:hypothetical protein